MTDPIPPQAWCPYDGRNRPRPDRLLPVTGIDCLNKPGRFTPGTPGSPGLWTSTWLGPDRVSDWVRWCTDEAFRGPWFNVWVLAVEPDARVYEIDSGDDLDRLVSIYGVPAPPHAGTTLQRSLDALGMFPFVDFDQIRADGWAGIHLTDDGQWATRYRYDRSVGAPSLYGWDCESTLWFGWAFASVERVGRVRVDRFAEVTT